MALDWRHRSTASPEKHGPSSWAAARMWRNTPGIAASSAMCRSTGLRAAGIWNAVGRATTTGEVSEIPRRERAAIARACGIATLSSDRGSATHALPIVLNRSVAVEAWIADARTTSSHRESALSRILSVRLRADPALPPHDGVKWASPLINFTFSARLCGMRVRNVVQLSCQSCIASQTTVCSQAESVPGLLMAHRRRRMACNNGMGA